MEWQVKQLTVAELACIPVLNEACDPLSWWQVVQNSAPARPESARMSDLSPPASMCFVPSPWQFSQILLVFVGSFAAPLGTLRTWGLPVNDFAWTSWQSLQRATDSELPGTAAFAGAAAGVGEAGGAV